MMFLPVHISRFGGVAIVALAIFGVLWSISRFLNKGVYFYFDPQDFVRAHPNERIFPASASSATFEPMLKHYIGVTQLQIGRASCRERVKIVLGESAIKRRR